ncbi:NAD(P)H-dependent oxidoreductase [Nocardioides sp. C4-1]|uniref:NADPH-dependent FMN reductase n=1 Tax=Nocardioides sp. C4-1 TaxID=3151851 RepID=UPI003263B115
MIEAPVTVVVGNPKPQSRTRQAASLLAEQVAGRAPDHVVDVADLGVGLLGWGDPAVTAARETVAASGLVVVASPTFKATYTGLLKLFLDQFEGGTGLAGVVAVPLMLGAAPVHAMAGELHLRPLLAELGATVPAPALFCLDKTFADDDRIAGYATTWGPVLRHTASLTPEGATA